MIEQHFGEAPPLSLGVEEELMILDPDSLDQVGGVLELLDEVGARPLPGELKTELFASVVEAATPVCADVGEAGAALGELRRAAAEAAAARGFALACAATHPFARPEAQPIVDEERYTSFVGYAGISARRQGVQGLHVHVGMPSGEDCWRALEWMLPWLPLVLALSANSPWLAGRLTGLASNRAPVLAELPRAGAPPAFGSYAGWEAWVERLVDLGVAADYTRIWWDARPHPRFGTLEVRMPDQPTALAQTVRFAAVVQALAATALEAAPPAAPHDRGFFQQNRWAAARFGPEAELIHPDGTRAARVPELWDDLLARLEPAARALGTLGLLEEVDAQTCEGAGQLEGDARDVTARIVARTLAS
ncbi:MAG TPA: YbdK family carboxylate-amine ligase [Gaiellaceae bacterium]|nr:YbdK family carboxylate-amine ligase [Gaiellaceae bacterium]